MLRQLPLRRELPSYFLTGIPAACLLLLFPYLAISSADVHVPYQLVEGAAGQFAADVFPGSSFGPVQVYYGLNGRPAAYYFVLYRRPGPCPSEDAIRKRVAEGHQLLAAARKSANRRDIDAATSIIMGNEDFITMVVSARYDAPPILEYYHALPPHYSWAEETQKVAAAILGEEGMKAERFIFSGPFDIWFEFRSAKDTVFVSPHSLRPFTAQQVRTVSQRTQSQEQSGEIAKEWARVRVGQSPVPFVGEFRIHGVPDYDWSYGCAPTASADVLGFWAENGYALLVDYYYDRWDDVEREWDYNVPNVIRELATAMETDTLSGMTGGSIPSGNEMVCNSPVYGNGYCFHSERLEPGRGALLEEINGGRPAHWSIVGHWYYNHHSVCAMGWGPPDDHYICIHDTYSTTPEECIVHYSSPVGGIVYSIVPLGQSSRGRLHVTMSPVFPHGSDHYQFGDHAEFNMTVQDPYNGYELVDAEEVKLQWTSRAGNLTPIQHVETGTYHFNVTDIYRLNPGWHTWVFSVYKTCYEPSAAGLRLPVYPAPTFEPIAISDVSVSPAHFDPTPPCRSVTITYSLSRTSDNTTLRILRPRDGSVVRTLFEGVQREGGSRAIVWDRRDHSEAYVAPMDSFLVRLDAASMQEVTPVGRFGIELSKPTGMAFGPEDDYLYVVDGNQQQVFAYQGPRLVYSWGEFGFGLGQFNHPGDIAFPGNGLIYIYDTAYGGRIQEFTSEQPHTATRQWFYPADWPAALTTDCDGMLYLGGADGVHKIDPSTGTETLHFRATDPDDTPSQNQHVAGVAVAGDGRIFVTILGSNTIRVYDRNGPFLDTLLCDYPEMQKWDLDMRGGNWLYVQTMRDVLVYDTRDSVSLHSGPVNRSRQWAQFGKAIAVSEDGEVAAVSLEPYFVMALTDYSSFARLERRLWSDESRPELSISLFQNPCITNHLDIYVIASEPVIDTSLVVTVAPDTVEMELLDPDRHTWRGDYDLYRSGTLSVYACARDLESNWADSARSFSSTRVLAATGGIAASVDGRCHVNVPAGAVGRDAYVLILESVDEGSGKNITYSILPHELYLRESAEISIAYDDTTKHPEHLCIVREEQGGAVHVKCFVDRKTHRILAFVDRFGSYGLVVRDDRATPDYETGEVKLLQNAPNPFSGTTSIMLEIPRPEILRIDVISAEGRILKTLIDGHLPSGKHRIEWDGRNTTGKRVASGVYAYRVRCSSGEFARKMVYLR
jgi:hypothetical protein